MIGVVLAAGQGKRLLPITSCIPKALVPLRGKRLIDYSLEAFRELGWDAVVVVGHLGEEVGRYLKRRYGRWVKTVYAKKVHSGNLASFLSAQPFLEDSSFLLTNADHIFEEASSLFRKLKEVGDREGTVVIAGHREREIGEDEMKVLSDEKGKPLLLSKSLSSYSGAYVGAFYVPRELSRRVFSEARKLFSPELTVEVLFPRVPCKIEWVDEFPLAEIDTWKDWRDVLEKGRAFSHSGNSC